MPGTDIPIVNEKVIFKKRPEFLLLLSWHISESLIKTFRKKKVSKENLLFLFQLHELSSNHYIISIVIT